MVVGRTGSGKTTFLGAINGLVPHFTGGHLAGRVTVDGRDTRTHPPRELADVVGMVGQDPLAGFVTDTVEEELAYAMEQLAVPADVMRKRVEETLDLLGIAELRDRALRTLSGGQQQRVAIGSVLTPHPRILVLDEPTSALDPTAAEDVLAAVTPAGARPRHHRRDGRAPPRAGGAARRPRRRSSTATAGRSTPRRPPGCATSELAPPVVRLGRLAGWEPAARCRCATPAARPARSATGWPTAPPARAAVARSADGRSTPRGLVVRYGDVVALRGVDLAGAAR